MRPEIENKILYFLIAIVIIGSLGIWIPPILYSLDNTPYGYKELYQNLTTYYIAIIVVSCTDLALSIIRSARLTNKIGKILWLILVGILCAFLFIFNCYLLWKSKPSSLLYIIAGIIIAYILWWISKWDSESFNPENALGGDAS